MNNRSTLRKENEVGASDRCVKWLVALAIVGVLIAAILMGSYRQSAGPAQGPVFQGVVRTPAQSGRQTLRVATYNIHGGRDARGNDSLDRTADCLHDADLIALNEVNSGLWAGYPNQAMALGERVGVAWLFAPAERRWWHDHFGNGCLTSLPVTYWQRIPLAGPKRGSRRNILWVQVQYQGRNVQVLVTHLDRQDDREGQLQAVAKLFLALTEPCVLLGDLNSREEEPTILELLAIPGVQDPVRECLGAATPKRIDWVLTRGLRGVQAEICDNGASDHPCFRVDLEISPGEHASG
jgi:endonuclease/exonuclease/phosphatase family metal-dependent hydrolase